jgi:hypothetical protein
MLISIKSWIFSFVMVPITALTVQANSQCVPVLFPHEEYNYKAEFKQLKTIEKISSRYKHFEFHNINLAIPGHWNYEYVLDGHAVRIFQESRTMLLSDSKPTESFDIDPAKMRLVGCNNFKERTDKITKTFKDYIADLFLLTEDQLDDEPNFWQYYILSSKVDYFRSSYKLIHYKGENLEAFQHDVDPKYSCVKSGSTTEITVFLMKIAPAYLTINGAFIADDTFEGFLAILDKLNP